MIHIIITSYNEPKSTTRAVRAFLNQKINDDFKIIVVDPFPEVEDYLKKNIKNKRVEFFLDPGEGKSYALNLLLEMIYSKNKKDLIILTDGDVYVSENSVEEIVKKFEDENVGCVAGRPISIDLRNSKFGFWSKVAFAGIDKTRRKLARKREFFECSGYLFAIRNGVLTSFPTKTSEDSIIPFLFWRKGYRIEYADRAEVYVKNPGNWKDWINQKTRNIKGHENLKKIAPSMPRTKSFLNEVREGAFFAMKQPKNMRELFWTFEMYFARLYIYFKAFEEMLTREKYEDGWRSKEIKSTRMFD